MKNEQVPKPTKTGAPVWAKFMGIGTEMAVAIFLPAFAGSKLDEKLAMQTPWFTIVFLFFGLATAFYLVYKQLK